MALRTENNPSYNYILQKTRLRRECDTLHQPSGMCGSCFWKGVTINPENIPECSSCKEDTETFGKIIKENPKAKGYELEPKCVRACIWWEWFHNLRKMKCGCMCVDACSCGKMKYITKKTSDAKVSIPVAKTNIKKTKK